jgi:hypothetical protein
VPFFRTRLHIGQSRTCTLFFKIAEKSVAIFCRFDVTDYSEPWWLPKINNSDRKKLSGQKIPHLKLIRYLRHTLSFAKLNNDVMKIGISIGAFMLLCSQALGQVVVNADGTHSIQHGPHIINPNGTISVQHGPHIIHPDGKISVVHGSTIINSTGDLSLKKDLLSDSNTYRTYRIGEPPNPSTITVSKTQKLFFNLRLGSPADRLDGDATRP